MISDEVLIGYLDGNVDLGRAREIDAALAASPDLRARLNELEGRDRSVREAFDALLDDPVPDALAQMVRAAAAKAEAAEAEKVVRFRAKPRRALLAAPGWLGWAAAAQFAAIVVLTGIALQPRHETATYRALGAAPVTAAGNLLVVFRPETPERTLRQALRAADARIVDGPTPADAYLLSVPAAERAGAVASLRARTEVVAAEPVDSAGDAP